jgi:hypothetical protein
MSNLRGTPTIRVLLDRRAVKQAQDDFAAALKHALPKAVGELCRRGAEHLRDLDDALGHETLADLWTYTPVKLNPDGSAEGTIYSEAEDMKFYRDTTDASGERVRSKKPSHVVDGDYLLSFLEGGTPPHRIDATAEATGGELFFPIAHGFKTSDFAGIASTHPGRDHAGLIFEGPDADGFFEGQSVEHPGFEGNHNILHTFLLMEQGVDQYLDQAGRDIVAAFNGR